MICSDISKVGRGAAPYAADSRALIRFDGA
jgi:hypothetical protein